jgi:hypothetical protein
MYLCNATFNQPYQKRPFGFYVGFLLWYFLCQCSLMHPHLFASPFSRPNRQKCAPACQELVHLTGFNAAILIDPNSRKKLFLPNVPVGV